MQELAIARNGKCLSNNYIDIKTKLEWQCMFGHEWYATPDGIKSGYWCPQCGGTAKLNIEEMQKLAVSRDGKCLSNNYVNARTKLEWQCTFGHKWYANSDSIKNGSWCPHCNSGSIGEELVRNALEEALPPKLFNRTRSEPWMQGLELDGFNYSLRLAFEYQGIQHYERVEHFKRKEGDFEAQLARDRKKQELCDDEFITLLIVPYTIDHKLLRTYVRNELEILAYEISPISCSDEEFYRKVRLKKSTTS